MKASRGVYDPLTAYLQSMPADRDQVGLRFSELERILGRPLPKSALRDEPWWANVNKRPANLTPWDAAGWRVQAVYLTAQIVVFRRAGTDIATDIERTIKLLLEPRTAPALLEAKTVKGWVRWCMRNGWYFEGKTLCEQGHFRREALSDTEQVEFEEDYATCKRNSAPPTLI